MKPTTKEEILTFMERMDALLEADPNDPKALIKALHGVTTASLCAGGYAGTPKLADWIRNSVDICTAYVQQCVEGRGGPYRREVGSYRDKIGEVALSDAV